MATTTSKTTKAPAKKAAAKAPAKKAKATQMLSPEELEALQDTRRERRKGSNVDGEADLRAALAKCTPEDRAIGERLHELVMAAAPSLAPKTWYGLPAWAGADGKAVVFYTPASKFKERYGSLGFNATARLDDGNMWPTSWALTKLGPAEEKQITALVRKAVG